MKKSSITLPANGKQQGFSLIEVLVALLVIAFGLLGVAGMQSVSIGNTSIANLRSVAALQASSMAAAMSSNEGYWQTPLATTSVTVINTTISGSGLGNASSTCVSSLCNPTQMAEADLTTWGSTLNTVLPNGYGTINCTTATPNAPVTCQILVFWSEKRYAQNQVAGASATASDQHDFEMMVQP